MVGSLSVIGRYAIHGKIASGGMASVHFGRLIGGAGFSRTVAIKRLHPHLAEDPDFLSTMIDEARLAARIHHPNVVPTLDVVAADGELLLVMEYVRGESLARLLKLDAARGGRVPLPVASAIIIGTLHGLHAAHEATSDRGAPLGIVHRDVSPQNILVGIDGVARVIDFGVAKAAGRLQTTREGTLKGKIAYMAPEQLNAKEVTRAADVYAMGVVAWETLTGRRLFQSDSDGALVQVVLAGAKDPPSRYARKLPPELDALVMRALALDPADRFATTRDMAERLMRVVPPAFPTDVGTWCEQTASESLAKRWALLAAIEGHSDDGPASQAEASRIIHGARSKVEATEVGFDEIMVEEFLEVEPALGSQASSLSVETPKPRVFARPGTRRGALLTGAVGGGVLMIAILALTRGRTTAPAASSTSGSVPLVPSAAATHIPESPVNPAADPPVPPPLASDAPTPAPPDVPSAAPAPSAAHVVAPRRPALSPPPQPRPPKVTCTPPWYFDSRGVRVFKPECL